MSNLLNHLLLEDRLSMLRLLGLLTLFCILGTHATKFFPEFNEQLSQAERPIVYFAIPENPTLAFLMDKLLVCRENPYHNESGCEKVREIFKERYMRRSQASRNYRLRLVMKFGG